MQKYEFGLLYGRFQPFHKGHLYLILQALTKVEKLIIGIGSANIHDENNPLTYEQRKVMLETVIDREKIKNKVVKIIPLNDYYNDDLWYKNTLLNAGKFDVVIGNNEWTNEIFSKNNHKILRIKFYRRRLYEGIKIRMMIKNDLSWQKRVPPYLVSVINNNIKTASSFSFRFNHVALGGTFDHFHVGHIKLIKTAFKYGKNVSIGITSDSFGKNKLLNKSIEKYEERKTKVVEFLRQNNCYNRAAFYKLDNIFGPTIIDGTIEALVVSKETFANVVVINQARKKNKLPHLDTILVPYELGQDNKPVSSVRIRLGEINSQGLGYFDIFKKNKILNLPNKMREELRKPIGTVFKGNENQVGATLQAMEYIKKINPEMIITVGDIVSDTFEKKGIVADIKILDYRTHRQNINERIMVPKNMKVNNPGTISFSAVSAIKKAIEERIYKNVKSVISIKGEEDLLALPAILLAPFHSIVFYGQYELGIIGVLVTEEKKKLIEQLISKFYS